MEFWIFTWMQWRFIYPCYLQIIISLKNVSFINKFFLIGIKKILRSKSILSISKIFNKIFLSLLENFDPQRVINSFSSDYNTIFKVLTILRNIIFLKQKSLFHNHKLGMWDFRIESLKIDFWQKHYFEIIKKKWEYLQRNQFKRVPFS